MKIKSISVSLARTVNLGNYESLKLQAGIEASTSDKDNIEQSFEGAWQECIDQIDTRIKEVAEELKKQNRPKRLRNDPRY